MIWRKESGKIWKYPLVWGLLLLFFLFNLWNIYISVGAYSRREWREMHEISVTGSGIRLWWNTLRTCTRISISLP